MSSTAGTIRDIGVTLALRQLTANVYTAKAARLDAEGKLQSALMECAQVIHSENRAKGWWSNLETGQPRDRNVGELLMLMVSELAEVPAWPDIYETMDDKLPLRVMAEVELADCAIRILDTAGAIARDFWIGYFAALQLEETDVVRHFEPRAFDVHLMDIVRALSNAMEQHRKAKVMEIPTPWADIEGGDKVTIHVRGLDFYLGAALHKVLKLGRSANFDVPGAVLDKMIFNRSREDHKIEARRGNGGKAY